MNEKMEKYADLILKKGVAIAKNQPLFLSFPMERIDFVRILVRRAFSYGVKDIFFAPTDACIKHEALTYLEEKELRNYSFWNKKEMNHYAKKHAAFVTLSSESPDLMKDVDANILSRMDAYALKTSAGFDAYRAKNELAWCIAAVPSTLWAEKVFPNEKDPVKKLWNTIFDVCLVKEKDPLKAWDEKIRVLDERKDKLNKYHFTSLHFQNDLGTDLIIPLSKKHLWANSKCILANGKEVICNLPSEEVFTYPKRDGVEGIVYSSKPLVHNGVRIEDFSLTFRKGKVVEVQAKTGEDALKKIIASDSNANRLGEVALVPYHSAISDLGIIFYETLYDENASCHLALGNGFTECLSGYENMSKRQQRKEGLNQSRMHVDFMIGTEDLTVTGTTKAGKEIPIMQHGDFVL